MAIPVGTKIALILKNGNLSNVVDVRDVKFISLILPALDSCDVTFEVSSEVDGDFVALKKIDATVVTITATTGGFATEYIDALAGYSWFKIKTSVAQETADRTIEVCFKE